MNNKPILSVLITTYNRVKFLETIVSLIISKIIRGSLSDKIEMIIGNDASPDDGATERYITKLHAQYPFVRAITHPQNLGYPGNIKKLTEMARGEYIWSIGEDDLITDGVLEKVLRIIDTNDPNYVLINTKNILSLDDRNLDYKIIGGARLDIKEDVFVKSFEAEKDKLSKIKNWLYLTNLCSSIIYRKKLFLDWIGEAEKYAHKDNLYAWQAAVIMGMSKSGRLYIIAEPLVLHRKNENHYSKSIHKLLKLNLYDSSELLDVVKDYMPDEYAEYQKRFAAFVLATILLAKKNKVNVNKYIIDAFKKNYNCYPYNVRFLIALVTPGIVFRTF